MADLLDIPTSFLFSRLFAIRPVIRKENGTLVAVSNWRTVALTLGALQRKVEVDPRQRTIRLRMRRFWFVVKTRRIEFDWVQSVVYGHAEMSTGSAMPMTAYQEQDLFSVGLNLSFSRSNPSGDASRTLSERLTDDLYYTLHDMEQGPPGGGS